METIRTFLGIKIPKNITDKIEKIQKEIENLGVDAKFVEKENLHFNLKFFGSRKTEETEKIKKVVKNAVPKFKKFELEISRIGVFPSKSAPRVLWLGVAEDKELEKLYDELENQFEKIGITKENRPFKAHLTLCRMRSDKNKENLIEKMSEYEHKSFGKFLVDELVLVQSKLSPKGPTYVDLGKFRLGEK